MTPDELSALLAVARQHGVTSLLIDDKGERGVCLKVDLALAAPKHADANTSPPTMGDLLDVYGQGLPKDV